MTTSNSIRCAICQAQHVREPHCCICPAVTCRAVLHSDHSAHLLLARDAVRRRLLCHVQCGQRCDVTRYDCRSQPHSQQSMSNLRASATAALPAECTCRVFQAGLCHPRSSDTGTTHAAVRDLLDDTLTFVTFEECFELMCASWQRAQHQSPLCKCCAPTGACRVCDDQLMRTRESVSLMRHDNLSTHKYMSASRTCGCGNWLLTSSASELMLSKVEDNPSTASAAAP